MQIKIIFSGSQTGMSNFKFVVADENKKFLSDHSLFWSPIWCKNGENYTKQ
jgi:hypothetical protein